jgi:phosphoribosylanthranilate isomerase
MTGMFVKICGITRVEDAVAAAELGADAIGFIFWPGSPRFVDPYRARRIAAALPRMVRTVGVFVDQPVDYIAGVANLVRLFAVQLHGDETPHAVAAVGRPAIKSIKPGASRLEEWPSNVTLLLDAHDPVKKGGTGTAVDWNAAAAIAAKRPVLLAGGLTPDNIADAIACVRPFGVDVSSGVETSPGVKNHARMQALFKAIHGYHNVPA